MRLRNKKISSVLLALLLLAALLPPVRAQALGRIDTAKDVTLTIQYSHDQKAMAGVKFDLYRVADVSDAGAFTLVGDFMHYPVSLEDLSAAGWRKLADTLAGYAQRDGLEPLDSGTTDRTGTLTFPAAGKTLAPGLYLVLGREYVDGRYTYTAEPFLVALPGLDNTGTKWVYDVAAAPKYTVRDDDLSDDTIRRRVLKVWDDQGSEDSRPSQVTVQLLRDGKVYDTVTLSEKNHWRYTWDDLDAGFRWTVVEKEIPGYTVTVSREGATFVVTNTEAQDGPDNPDDPDNPDNPNIPDVPDNPSNPDDPNNPDSPDDPNNPDNPSGPNNPNNPGGPDNPKLPQTGVLWWPVPVLSAAGLLLIVVGCVRRRKDDGE